MSDLYERVVREAMERLRLTRKRAERAATKLMKRVKPEVVALELDRLSAPIEPPRAPTRHGPGAKQRVKKSAPGAVVSAVSAPGEAFRPKVAKKRKPTMTAEEIAKLPPVNPPRPPPKTALERLERALGPDDGRRRGGRPVLQGGSPGLGRRR